MSGEDKPHISVNGQSTVNYYCHASVHPIDGTEGITFSRCPSVRACVRRPGIEPFSDQLAVVGRVHARRA